MVIGVVGSHDFFRTGVVVLLSYGFFGIEQTLFVSWFVILLTEDEEKHCLPMPTKKEGGEVLLGNNDDNSRCDCQPFHNKRIHKKEDGEFEKKGMTVIFFQVILVVFALVILLLVQDPTNASLLPVVARLLLLFAVVVLFLHKNQKDRISCCCGSNQSNYRFILLYTCTSFFQHSLSFVATPSFVLL